jgi:hypothetical protein
VHYVAALGRHERLGTSFAALSVIGTANSAACRSAIGRLLATISILTIGIFRNFADRDFSNFVFLLIVFFADHISKKFPVCTHVHGVADLHQPAHTCLLRQNTCAVDVLSF